MENIKKEIDNICRLIKDEVTDAYNKKNFGRIVADISEVIERSIDADYLKGQYAGYNLLGNMNFDLCNYPEAQENFLRSLSIAEKMEDEKNISFAQNNIGIIFFRLKEFDKALEYYYKALEIKLKIKDEASIS
ncbi:MAG TPA: tetratricopeptide repeat protein, partial [Bacteroidales bacterium]|nr:tetratricopeptide repeat protein [Bacteroidales bacterium]